MMLIVVPQSYSVVTCSCTRGEGTSHGSHCWTTPASGGQNSFCCVQTVDVIWAGLDTNQDHLLAIFAAAHCFICGEDNLMAELQVTNSYKLRLQITMPCLKQARNSKSLQRVENTESVDSKLRMCSGILKLVRPCVSVMFNYNLNISQSWSTVIS